MRPAGWPVSDVCSFWVTAFQPEKLSNTFTGILSLHPTWQSPCRMTADVSDQQGAHQCEVGKERRDVVSGFLPLLSPQSAKEAWGLNTELWAPPFVFKHLVAHDWEWIYLRKFAEALSPLQNCSWPSWKELRTFCEWWASAKVNTVWLPNIEGFLGNPGFYIHMCTLRVCTSKNS